MAPLTRIDVHHHHFAGSMVVNGTTKHDWLTPKNAVKWTPEVSIEAMDKLGIRKAILSNPNPMANAHDCNVDASKIVAGYPARFGFFATLPLGHASMDVVLEELRFALDELKADGIAMVSSYGQGSEAKYVGHDDFAPLWEALHNRKAIVFLHGAQANALNAPPGELLPVPVVELSNYVGNTKFGSSLSTHEILEDFKSSYYETALNGYDVNLAALQKFVGKNHILFGTDFPAVTVDMANWFTENLDEFFVNDQSSHSAIMSENWEKLQN
ncbi:hypothetical protein N7490_009531 [Penicillium lividum]|nr:hypothetical protein N7490_009531 [Penicillium lividum]